MSKGDILLDWLLLCPVNLFLLTTSRIGYHFDGKIMRPLIFHGRTPVRILVTYVEFLGPMQITRLLKTTCFLNRTNSTASQRDKS